MKHLVSYFVSCTNSIKVVFIIGCYIYYTTFRIFQKKIILLCTISQKEVEGSGSIMEYSLIQDKLRIFYDIELAGNLLAHSNSLLLYMWSTPCLSTPMSSLVENRRLKSLPGKRIAFIPLVSVYHLIRFISVKMQDPWSSPVNCWCYLAELPHLKY